MHDVCNVCLMYVLHSCIVMQYNELSLSQNQVSLNLCLFQIHHETPGMLTLLWCAFGRLNYCFVQTLLDSGCSNYWEFTVLTCGKPCLFLMGCSWGFACQGKVSTACSSISQIITSVCGEKLRYFIKDFNCMSALKTVKEAKTNQWFDFTNLVMCSLWSMM